MVFPIGLLEGTTAVVTGGARGIGHGIAELFLEQGANVAIGDLLELAPDDPLRAYGDRLLAMHCDVALDADVGRLIRATAERYGRIDCLVNNAADPGPVEGLAGIEPDDFDRTVAVVLRSVFSGMRHVAAVMRRQGGGSIVNIGSTSGLRASSTLQPYGAAKAGVGMLTQSAAVELGADGIRVNCLCPGGIATALYGVAAGLDANAAVAAIPHIASRLAGMQPLGRAGTPREVANVALWLASELSAYVTGQVIAVDGGLTVGRPLPPGVGPREFFGRIATDS